MVGAGEGSVEGPSEGPSQPGGHHDSHSGEIDFKLFGQTAQVSVKTFKIIYNRKRTFPNHINASLYCLKLRDILALFTLYFLSCIKEAKEAGVAGYEKLDFDLVKETIFTEFHDHVDDWVYIFFPLHLLNVGSDNRELTVFNKKTIEKIIKSLCDKSTSKSANSMPSSFSASSSRDLLLYNTLMSQPFALFTALLPMRPNQITPRVLPSRF